MESDISVHIVKEWESTALMHLYKAGGWWLQDHDPAHLPDLVRSSFAFAVAVDSLTGRSVGMGRVISDGVSDGYIQDLVVVPEFRRKGVGRKIILYASRVLLRKEDNLDWPDCRAGDRGFLCFDRLFADEGSYPDAVSREVVTSMLSGSDFSPGDNRGQTPLSLPLPEISPGAF